MSMDYPFYEELCRKKHRAAWWWIVGDRLHYLGLLLAFLALPVVALIMLTGAVDIVWHRVLLIAGMFIGGIAVLFAGAALKGRAYVLAERDGISSSEVSERGSDPPG